MSLIIFYLGPSITVHTSYTVARRETSLYTRLFGGEGNFEYASWDCTIKYRVSFLLHKFVANVQNYQNLFILKENSVFGKAADGQCRVAKFQPHFVS